MEYKWNVFKLVKLFIRNLVPFSSSHFNALRTLRETRNGDLDLRNTEITELPQNLKVKGTLNLSGCVELSDLPKNLEVGGDLLLWHCTGIKEIPESVKVKGNIYYEQGVYKAYRNHFHAVKDVNMERIVRRIMHDLNPFISGVMFCEWNNAGCEQLYIEYPDLYFVICDHLRKQFDPLKEVACSDDALYMGKLILHHIESCKRYAVKSGERERMIRWHCDDVGHVLLSVLDEYDMEYV